MNVRQPIQDALAPLIGLPMWEAGWAGDIAWFAFGAPVTRLDHRGRERVVSEYALHLSSPWRWIAPSGFVRADETSPREALGALGVQRPHVAEAEVSANGEVTLRFDSGDRLLIDPPVPKEDVDPDDDDDPEFWRLLQPGVVTPHFVVSSSGVEWHEGAP